MILPGIAYSDHQTRYLVVNPGNYRLVNCNYPNTILVLDGRKGKYRFKFVGNVVFKEIITVSSRKEETMIQGKSVKLWETNGQILDALLSSLN